MEIQDKELYSDWFCTVGIDIEEGKGYYSDISCDFKWMSILKAEYIAKKLHNGEDKILKFI